MALKPRSRILLFLTGIFLAMGLFNFIQRQQSDGMMNRLVWFELQIAPDAYRFAIMPEQPILIGYEGADGEKGVTMMIRHEQVPDVYERTIEQVDALVRKTDLLNLPPSNPQAVFSEAAMKIPSIHMRMAYADNTRWAGVYDLTDTPPAVATLIQESRLLAEQLMQDQPGPPQDEDPP